MARTKNLSRYGSTQKRRVLDTLSRQRRTAGTDNRETPHVIEFLTVDEEGKTITRTGSFWAFAPGGDAWVVVDGEFTQVTRLKANNAPCTRSDNPREPGTWVQASKAHRI